MTLEDGTLIGDVLLALRSVEHETLEVGYIFSPRHGGRGYATETVRALLDLAFGELGARRVIARVDERNTASRALLDRLGIRREAHLVENEWFKGELTSEVDYAVLAREWPALTEATDVSRPRSPRIRRRSAARVGGVRLAQEVGPGLGFGPLLQRRLSATRSHRAWTGSWNR